MSITFELNKEHNGIEISFSDRPTSKVIAELKKLGFRWHGAKKVWYAKQTDERIAFAKSIEDKMVCEQTSLFDKQETPAQEPKQAKKSATKTEKTAEPNTTSKKSTKKSEPKQETKTKQAEPKQEKVVSFQPKLTFSFGTPSATIEDVKAKTDEERKTFTGQEHGYVFDGIMKMAETNEQFRAKYIVSSYEQAFAHVVNMAKKQAKNGYCCMSADDVLEIICEYILSEKKEVKRG